MDQRTTFETYAELLHLLTRLRDTRASFIVDSDGLTRLDGTITDLTPAADQSQSLLVLDGATTLHLSQVIAVNGIFRSDYTEC
jgi:hypothetical protein